MDFYEALKILDIEDYADRIWNSNSHGELFHINQYIHIAEVFKDNHAWFRGWFEDIVEYADHYSDRPASIFQHIDKILIQTLKSL